MMIKLFAKDFVLAQNDLKNKPHREPVGLNDVQSKRTVSLYPKV